MRILLTGGGTGGHLYPGLAVADECLKRIPCEICFVGTRHGLEARVVPEKGYGFRTVWIGGFQRGKVLRNLLFPVKVVVSLIQAFLVVGRFRPDVVMGTGGYVSWPVLVAAILLRKKTMIQEQNLAPGVVTRFLAPWVDSVHLSFEGSVKFFRKQSNLRVSGNPTRENLEKGSRQEGCRRFDLRHDRTTLFVLGGSQGARGLNRAVLTLLDGLKRRRDVQVLWSAGPAWVAEIRDGIKEYEDRVRVFPYIDAMDMAYGVSDLLICRSGATTVAEVTRLGLSAVFVPFPWAAGGHQEENARMLQQAGAAEMVLESEIAGGRLEEVVFSLLDDVDRRKAMGRRAKEFGRPDAAGVIVNDMLSLCKTSVSGGPIP